MNGKGDDRRPSGLTQEEWARRWDAVFPPKPEPHLSIVGMEFRILADPTCPPDVVEVRDEAGHLKARVRIER